MTGNHLRSGSQLPGGAAKLQSVRGAYPRHLRLDGMPDSDGQIRVGIKVASHDARQRYTQTNFPKPMVTASTPPRLECLLIGGVGTRAVHDAGSVAMKQGEQKRRR